ncbi:hypothetical protein Q8A67_010177 [Cirrhinus molitorella]|uniref:Uncharacterized protein n=1 Tax=Cirrhinus molitorella TaxID=172907 RepID=A0AA88PRV6_9TELE|nr:hypothetical protein Q8A67_010177 [Cirrhinus molitorella]
MEGAPLGTALMVESRAFGWSKNNYGDATYTGLTTTTFGSESRALLADVPLEACNMRGFTGQPVKCDVALKMLSIHPTSVLQVARDKWTHPINHLTETLLLV